MGNTNNKNLSKYLISTFLIVGLTTLSIQAWSGLTASPGDKLDYQKWNELVASVQSGIPSGAVMAFNLSTCPTGWSSYNDAIGRTIIGVGNGAGSNTSLGNIGGEKSAPAISATHNLTANVTGYVKIASKTATSGSVAVSDNAVLNKGGGTAANIYSASSTTADTNIGPLQSFSGAISGGISISGGGTAPDNMQPYVALLYCVKN